MAERKEDIRHLLDRYMAGETSLEEEARLAAYFRSPNADKDFAAFREMFSLFDQGEPSFSEQETNGWTQDGQHQKTVSTPQKTHPLSRLRRTARLVIGLTAAASIAAVSFHLGTILPEHHIRPQMPVPPEVRTVTLTQVKWRTDTVYIEKLVTVHPTVTAALPATDSLNATSAPLRQTEMAYHEPDLYDSTEMPHLVDIQAEFAEQRKRMEEISKQYELVTPSYENTY